ncbi:aminoacylase-1 [Arabidopsis lyrata subsp. lyrata]|uniref:aminoacylase-1 n=1 Tax=Arabidopsis lyrata subsp. lyrata TaxID=81972 RepID=UPI000A29C2C7|nr:aminoacylase-1 [Arabidopsis lyrata subsp. lyrata]|eukprot:XP_020885486.1 aminoacylase-1 [Arabidopsis lyrata subsp. lyrata]
MASIAEQAIIVSRFQEYLRINTVQPNPNYMEAVQFIFREAHLIGLQAESIEFVAAKPIVLLKWTGSDESLPAILLNSHIDVVSFEEDNWDRPPLGAEIDGEGKIYAKGTQDMKSVGMQYLEAIRMLKASGFNPLRSVYVLFVPDHEHGGTDGVRMFVQSEKFMSLNIAVVLDKGLPSPTESYRVFNGERVPWFLEIQAVGQAGHDAKLYDNSAMENLTKSIECIMRYRASLVDELKAGFMKEGHVVSVNMVYLNAGTLQPTGFVMNQQPTQAVAGFAIRLPPFADSDELRRRILKEWAPATRNMSFQLSRADEGIAREKLVTATDDSNPWWGLLQNAVKQAGGVTSGPEIFPASTNSWFFRKAGLPAIGFSPISNTPSLRHDNNEYLSRSEYLKGIDMYVSILMAYTLHA